MTLNRKITKEDNFLFARKRAETPVVTKLLSILGKLMSFHLKGYTSSFAMFLCLSIEIPPKALKSSK
jgi:hypothetical protein